MKKNIISFLLIASTLISCVKEKPLKLNISAYVNDVSSTAPVLVSGKFQGEDVDYVLSSQPVIFASMNNPNKTTDLSVKVDLREEFSSIYNTNGFPQAGLFIRSDLLNDDNKSDVLSLLDVIDSACLDLVNGASLTIDFMKTYSEDLSIQADRFDFNMNVLKAVQKENGLAFISHDTNPDIDELSRFKLPLGIDIAKDDLSSLYQTDGIKDNSFINPFSIISPKGAPSATLARFADDEKIDIAAPNIVQSTFAKKDKDFIIFDSVNGVKLSKKNGDSYKLIRMLTYGNLYLVSTGNDSDGKLDEGDFILGYSEGLIPDLVFKAVYSA